MDQDKSQAKRVDTAGAEATRGEAGLTAGADRTSTTVADRSGPAGEATRPARGTRGGTVRPKRAGETMGETVSGPRDAKVPKLKAQADGRAASDAKSMVDPGPATASTKLDRVVALLRAPGGASLPELQAATGWQVHSVRGAMAGALRKKGYSVTSEKPEDGLRRYRIAEAS